MATTPDHAQPSSPNEEPKRPHASNSGANDNPDEFSEFRKPNAPGTEDYSAESRQADPREQPGHVEQNQNPDAVAAAQNADNDEQRAAWKADDPRYGSGHRPGTQRSPADGGEDAD
ncbi:hypothetical protein [Hymenobacter jeollabukensis]|uniref:Uncharacterized protein n=1 Tax=Hymenobacter jeollabukensis TaxID=2025313 RepID=A0A5R8WXV2_9BACT|nr:hypothetical protein [Hymenobacter jeollabukensis]TLM96975.1 hypothetical protein FDY95_02990 [Hymenobacter jeollabukensis]